MRLRYNKDNSNLAYYINEKTANACIAINDVIQLKRYITQVCVKRTKEFNKNETFNVRVYLQQPNYSYEELKMFIDKLEYGDAIPNDSSKYILSIRVDENNYLNIYIKRYAERKLYQSIYHINKDNIQIEKINLDAASTQDHIIFDLKDKLKKYAMDENETTKFLNNWKTYYESQLEVIANEKTMVVASVLLDEFRKNIEFWRNIKDNNIIYFPVKVLEERSKLNSTSLNVSGTDGKSEDLLRDYTGIKFKVLSRTNAQDFFEKALENYDYNIACDVGYIENDDGIKVSFNKLLDHNIIRAELKRNVIGDIIRLKRIIEGIEAVINSKVMNENLVMQIINNELPNNNYKINKKNIDILEKTYNINEEQAIIVDKILNMDDLFLVQGPPGTGKTTIISTVVKELDKLDKRVLLTSNVKEARLNIIERIKGEKELIIKEYTDLKIDSEKHKQELKNNKLRYIENQIIEKFSYNNVFISSPEEYEKLLNEKQTYEEHLQYINVLKSEKKNLEKLKKSQIEEIDKLKQEKDEIAVNNKNKIYELILTNKLEKTESNIFGNHWSKFIELYNSSDLPNLVEKLCYHQKVRRKLVSHRTLPSKVDLYNQITADLLIGDADILHSNFIKEYSTANKFKRWLFNLSNAFKSFRIANTSKKEALRLCDECDNAIKSINGDIIINSYEKLIKEFINYIDEKIESISVEIKSYDYMLNSKDNEIEEELNKNFYTNEKIKNITDFIESFDSIKGKYKNETLFYNYLNTLKEITNPQANQDYVDKMLSRKYFSNIFEYYSSLGGNILSMSTNQVAKFFENDTEGFDYIIVDEASKCNFNDLIISLSKTDKLVLIGDYLQLDPVEEEKTSEILTDEQWKHIQLSNFSQLIKPVLEKNFKRSVNYNRSNSIGILKKQYRMSEEIYEIISKIYDSIDGFGIENSKIVNPYNHYRNVLALQCDGVESMRTEEETSRFNEVEITKVYEIVSDIVQLAKESKINNIKKIGIISFYKLQSKRISNKLSQLKKELYSYGIEVQIGTVDNFQGREFDLVIVSCVRTELTMPFLTEIRRWNVSISRAKDKLIVLGNFDKLYANSRNRKIDPNLSQDNKELSVIYNEIIPTLNNMSEQYGIFENDVKDFIRRGNE